MPPEPDEPLPPEGGQDPPGPAGSGAAPAGDAAAPEPDPPPRTRPARKTRRQRTLATATAATLATETAMSNLDPISSTRTLNLSNLSLASFTMPAIDLFFIPRPVAAVDPVADDALRRVPEKLAATGPAEGRDMVEMAQKRVFEGGYSQAVSDLTARLRDTAAVDRTARLLLSTRGVYHFLFLWALDVDNVDPKDTTGMFNSIVRNVNDLVAGTDFPDLRAPRHFYAAAVVDIVAEKRLITITPATLYDRLVGLVRGTDLPVGTGQPEAVVLNLLAAVQQDGDIPRLVEDFAALGEVEASRFTPAVKQAMVQYLKDIGLRIIPNSDPKRYDEYMALAYQHALTLADGNANDPLDAARRRGTTNWNFEVDPFDYEQAVVKANILAAGALDYVYVLGEHLGVFRLADALVLRWAAGALDVAQGPTAGRLYRYWKLREERSSPEERAMLYKRVFDRGDAQLLGGMVVNEHFPTLWGDLMTEVAKYIEKSEGSSLSESFVSRMPVYQATRQLQFNLTEHMTGMAHMQVTEMYAHLREAMDLLSSPEILDQYASGRRRSVWTVIERASKDEFGTAPNIAGLRTLAVDGNRIFKWIAEFDQGAVRSEDFRAFVDAAESWILAQGSAEDAPDLGGGEHPVPGDDEDDWDD
jgi:hypothetical protein